MEMEPAQELLVHQLNIKMVLLAHNVHLDALHVHLELNVPPVILDYY